MEDFDLQAAYHAEITMGQIEQVLLLLYQRKSHVITELELNANLNLKAFNAMEL